MKVQRAKYTVKKVLEGELLELELGGWPPGKYTVQAKCGYDGVDPETGKPRPSKGQFVCVTHGVAFASQLTVNQHVVSRVGAGKARKHRLAWWCWDHKAFEVP